MTEPSVIQSRVGVDGKWLETRWWKIAGAHQTIVLIHEALGSASYWKNFPAQLAQRTRRHILAYSRAGHGESEGPIEPRSIRYYEYQVKSVLPSLMQEFEIDEPVLYGHSEGAAIALLYAAAGNPVKAIIAESPIVVPEEGTLAAVEQMEETKARKELIEKLGRYHRDAEAVFDSWVDGVHRHLARDFPSSAYLTEVRSPVLVLQGATDPFGGRTQKAALESALARVHGVVLPKAGHLPHREEPEMVIECIIRFLSHPPKQGRSAVRR